MKQRGLPTRAHPELYAHHVGRADDRGGVWLQRLLLVTSCPLRSTALASRSSRRRCTGSRFDELRLNRYVHIIADRRIPGRQAKIGAIEMPVGGKSERFLLRERVRRVA